MIDNIGYENEAVKFYPYIIALDKDGQYAAHMLAYDAIEGLEIRESGGREYRGFDRTLLLNELTSLRTRSAN